MMYNRVEIHEAILAAEENIKICKEQIKRMDKMLAIQQEILDNNCFGCIKPGIFDYEEFYAGMKTQLNNSTENLKKYKKMLKLLDELDELNK